MRAHAPLGIILEAFNPRTRRYERMFVTFDRRVPKKESYHSRARRDPDSGTFFRRDPEREGTLSLPIIPVVNWDPHNS